ncbi:hypothetical protein EDD86DRAFT_246276 [Gorgonomyces haynaldii]|nr:hypothetical protein EDD86DRAFT_246276 [Gorgonomyces haynaldii]
MHVPQQLALENVTHKPLQGLVLPVHERIVIRSKRPVEIIEHSNERLKRKITRKRTTVPDIPVSQEQIVPLKPVVRKPVVEVVKKETPKRAPKELVDQVMHLMSQRQIVVKKENVQPAASVDAKQNENPSSKPKPEPRKEPKREQKQEQEVKRVERDPIKQKEAQDYIKRKKMQEKLAKMELKAKQDQERKRIQQELDKIEQLRKKQGSQQRKKLKIAERDVEKDKVPSVSAPVVSLDALSTTSAPKPVKESVDIKSLTNAEKPAATDKPLTDLPALKVPTEKQVSEKLVSESGVQKPKEKPLIPQVTPLIPKQVSETHVYTSWESKPEDSVPETPVDPSVWIEELPSQAILSSVLQNQSSLKDSTPSRLVPSVESPTAVKVSAQAPPPVKVSAETPSLPRETHSSIGKETLEQVGENDLFLNDIPSETKPVPIDKKPDPIQQVKNKLQERALLLQQRILELQMQKTEDTLDEVSDVSLHVQPDYLRPVSPLRHLHLMHAIRVQHEQELPAVDFKAFDKQSMETKKKTQASNKIKTFFKVYCKPGSLKRKKEQRNQPEKVVLVGKIDMTKTKPMIKFKEPELVQETVRPIEINPDPLNVMSIVSRMDASDLSSLMDLYPAAAKQASASVQTAGLSKALDLVKSDVDSDHVSQVLEMSSIAASSVQNKSIVEDTKPLVVSEPVKEAETKSDVAVVKSDLVSVSEPAVVETVQQTVSQPIIVEAVQPAVPEPAVVATVQHKVTERADAAPQTGTKMEEKQSVEDNYTSIQTDSSLKQLLDRDSIEEISYSDSFEEFESIKKSITEQIKSAIETKPERQRDDKPAVEQRPVEDSAQEKFTGNTDNQDWKPEPPKTDNPYAQERARLMGINGRRLTASALSRKLDMELQLFSAIDDSRVQITSLERNRSVTLAQHESVALVQLLVEKERQHRLDLENAKKSVPQTRDVQVGVDFSVPGYVEPRNRYPTRDTVSAHEFSVLRTRQSSVREFIPEASIRESIPDVSIKGSVAESIRESIPEASINESIVESIKESIPDASIRESIPEVSIRESVAEPIGESDYEDDFHSVIEKPTELTKAILDGLKREKRLDEQKRYYRRIGAERLRAESCSCSDSESDLTEKVNLATKNMSKAVKRIILEKEKNSLLERVVDDVKEKRMLMHEMKRDLYQQRRQLESKINQLHAKPKKSDTKQSPQIQQQRGADTTQMKKQRVAERQSSIDTISSDSIPTEIHESVQDSIHESIHESIDDIVQSSIEEIEDYEDDFEPVKESKEDPIKTTELDAMANRIALLKRIKEQKELAVQQKKLKAIEQQLLQEIEIQQPVTQPVVSRPLPHVAHPVTEAKQETRIEPAVEPKQQTSVKLKQDLAQKVTETKATTAKVESAAQKDEESEIQEDIDYSDSFDSVSGLSNPSIKETKQPVSQEAEVKQLVSQEPRSTQEMQTVQASKPVEESKALETAAVAQQPASETTVQQPTSETTVRPVVEKESASVTEPVVEEIVEEFEIEEEGSIHDISLAVNAVKNLGLDKEDSIKTSQIDQEALAELELLPALPEKTLKARFDSLSDKEKHQLMQELFNRLEIETWLEVQTLLKYPIEWIEKPKLKKKPPPIQLHTPEPVQEIQISKPIITTIEQIQETKAHKLLKSLESSLTESVYTSAPTFTVQVSDPLEEMLYDCIQDALRIQFEPKGIFKLKQKLSRDKVVAQVKDQLFAWMEYSQKYGEDLTPMLLQESRTEDKQWSDTREKEDAIKQRLVDALWENILNDVILTLE